MNRALLALAARAEAGGGGALSDDVWRAMGWSYFGGGEWTRPEKSGDDPDRFVYGPRPSLDTSIDAQAELPGRIVSMWHEADYVAAEARGLMIGRAPTEPLARLAALLRAMAAAKEAGDGE